MKHNQTSFSIINFDKYNVLMYANANAMPIAS